MSDSNNSGSLFGIIAFVLALVSIVMAWFFEVTTFSLIVFLAGFALALFDLIKNYKGEGLSFKELISVSGKERIFSLLTIISVIPFSYAYYVALTLESIDSLF